MIHEPTDPEPATPGRRSIGSPPSPLVCMAGDEASPSMSRRLMVLRRGSGPEHLGRGGMFPRGLAVLVNGEQGTGDEDSMVQMLGKRAP